jgi:hypothetical protein
MLSRRSVANAALLGQCDSLDFHDLLKGDNFNDDGFSS